MNPEDQYQLELDLEDVKTTLDSWDDKSEYTLSPSYTTVTNSSGLDVSFSYDSDTMESTANTEVLEKVEHIGSRLSKIEKALGIPEDLKRNKEIEKEYPHIKKLAEKYEQEVEKHITLKLLTPDLPE